MDTLLNRRVDLTNIVETMPQKFGELLIKDSNFIIKFFWTTKRIPFDRIQKVMAYTSVNMGLENDYKILEIHTIDNNIISFDPNQSSHRDVVSNFIKLQFKKTINLDVDDYPPNGADKYGTIIGDQM
jgi:hypothetical protein